MEVKQRKIGASDTVVERVESTRNARSGMSVSMSESRVRPTPANYT